MSAAGLRKLLLGLVVAGTSVLVCGQAPEYETHPREFIRTATYNELHSQGEAERFMWKDTEQKPKGSTTKLMVETKQGVISRMIAINGRPLNQQERAQDDSRVNRLLTDPSALRKKQQEQRDDEQHAQRLLASIPDAFLFKYEGIAETKNGKAAHYTFTPDPDFTPPNHETRVLTGMKGDLYIDLDAKRIAKIDATLFQAVDFGWGILGRLDKGGHFLIEQTCLGGPRWETTHSVLHFTGKIMMFKSMNIQEDETLFDFQHVSPDLTLAQGIAVMKKADEVVAENGGGNGQR
ncbi:MAG TPA: hypothetical protein VGL89_20095 [Candidatus Koribacter sp.]|jgi:hypothetical protein